MENNKVKSVTLKEFLKVLRWNWGVIFITFCSVVLTIGFLTFTSERVYEASATLSIQENGDLQEQLFNLPSIIRQKYLIKNQVAVSKSRTIAAKVIKELQKSVHKDSLSILGNEPSGNVPTIRERIFSWLSRPDSQSNVLSIQQIVRRFQSNTDVSYGIETDIIKLKGKAPTPWEAACLVNTWVEVYQDYNRSSNLGEVIQTRMLLEAKLKEYENKLSRSEDQLTQYQKEEKFAALTAETEQLVFQVANFESLYKETQTELEGVKNQLQYLKNQLDESKKNLVENMGKLSNANLQELQRQMTDLEIEKTTLEAQLIGAGLRIEGNEILIQKENRLNGIREKIKEETTKLLERDMPGMNPLDYSENLVTKILDLETTQKSLVAKTVAQKAIVEEYTNKLKTLPDKSQKLARLERDVKLNSNIYTMLAEQLEETRIREAGQMGNIHVLDFAESPSKAVYPRTFLNMILGCFFGLLLGVGFAFVRDYFEDSIKSGEDLEKMGLFVIGHVPSLKKIHVSNRYKKKDWSVDRAREIFPYLLIHQNGYSTVTEAYRSIRTSIHFATHNTKSNTVLFTSAEPAEGKSTTAANLSIMMARKGVKTLLVDTDLRRPVLDVLFMGSHRKIGLSNYLGREMGWRDVLRETAVTGLHLIGAGAGVKNAPEILSSKSMLSFLKGAKNEYGIVIFDSPPLLPVTDAMVLASIVDGVILVVKSGKTKKESVNRSIDILRNIEAHILGVVLTNVPSQDLYSYRDYYDAYLKGA